MKKLAVVYFPKLNLDKIDTFREKYDPGWKIIPPHITIVSPVSEISENQLIEHVESTIKDVGPFSIHLTGLTKTSDNCLFLLVKEGAEAIVDLHDKLYSGILHPYIPVEYLFEPHITLGEFGTRDDSFDLCNKVYAEAQNLNFDITCDFDTVSVIKGDGLSPAKIIKTICLQS